MKRLYTLLVCQLTIMLAAGSLPVAAQQAQDALYIFRNDGSFDYFFYGDIDHFEFSKIDTLGVEHDDYVTQEIWALDTVYRIPISAIDSVAFVTPENKVKDDVFCPDASIIDYIAESDSVWWILLVNAPEEIIPKVGDKLLIDQECELLPDGFGGRVIIADRTPDGVLTLIAVDDIAITDIYDRLIVKVAATTDKDANQAKWRRIADGTFTFEVPEETFELPKFEKSATLSGQYVITPDGAPVTIAGDLTGTLASSMEAKLTFRSCLFIDPLSGFQYDQKMVWDTKENHSIDIAGSLTGRAEVSFLKKALTKKVGKLKLDIDAGLYLEGSLTGFQMKETLKSHTRTACQLAMNERDIHYASGLISVDPLINISSESLEDTVEYSSVLPHQEGLLLLPEKMSIGCGVFAKASTKFGLPLEKTKEFPEILRQYLSSYAKNDTVGFGAELSLDLGGKIDMQAPWWLLWDNTPLAESQPVYKQLDEKSEFQAAVFAKLTAQLKLGKWQLGRPFEKAWQSDPRGLVPRIKGIEAAVDDEELPLRPYRWRFTSPIERPVLVGVNIGFLALDANQQTAAEVCDLGWKNAKIFDQGIKYFKDGTYYNTMNLDPVKEKPVVYTVYPLVELPSGRKVLVNHSKEVQMAAAGFEIAQRTIQVGERSGYLHGEYIGSLDVEVTPNMEHVNVTTPAGWLGEPLWDAQQNKVSFSWDNLPEGVKTRRGIIFFTGLSQKGEELAVDSIVVIQSRPYMELEPEKLVFPMEGGTKTVIVKETSYTDLMLKIPESSPYIHGSMEGNVITITVDENADPESRGNIVRIQGKFDGETGYGAFEVEQAGTGAAPGVKVYNRTVEFLGGEYEYPITATNVSNLEVTSDKSFVNPEITTDNNGNPVLKVWVSRNYSYSNKRAGTATLTGTDTNENPVTLIQVNINQYEKTDAFEIVIGEVSMEVGVYTKPTNDPDYQRYVETTAYSQEGSEINMVKEGNVMHVSGIVVSQWGEGSSRDLAYSFDIQDWSAFDSGNVTFSNVSIEKTERTLANGKDESAVRRIKANGIKQYDEDYGDGWDLWTNSEGDYQYERDMRFRGSEADGMTITDFFASWKYDVLNSELPGDHRYVEYNYVSAPENSATITLQHLVKKFIHND